jgi:hypothetical protein
MTRIPRWLPSVVLAAVLALAAGITIARVSFVRTMVLGSVASHLLHRPSDRDQFFFLVAVDFEQPALCDRIDGRADGSTGGGWGREFQIRTLRSVCHSQIAERSPQTPMWRPAFTALVRELGYTDADLAEWVYNSHHYSTLVDDLYRDLLANDEFRSRLRAAASYAEPRDPARLRSATPLEFVYQMVAIDAPEAALCSRISPNATLKDNVGAPRLLQSQCYLHIAFNTRDSGLCEPLPADRSFPHVSTGYDSRKGCESIVAMLRQRDVKNTRTDGPTRLTRAAELRQVLRDIGYPVDRLPQLPKPTDDDYREFVSDLRFRGPADARAEFLRRVAALP